MYVLLKGECQVSVPDPTLTGFEPVKKKQTQKEKMEKLARENE